MKRSKKLYLLMGVLVFVCLMTFIVSKYEEKKELIKNTDEIVLQVPKEQVTFLSWEYGTQSLSFHKNEGWVYDEDEAFPVSEEALDELLEVFEEFAVSFVIREVEDYNQYGLTEPTCTIRIGTEAGEQEILLGNYSTMDSQRYVSIGDGKVYLAKVDPLESYSVGLSDMIAHDVPPAFEKVTKIQFAGAYEYEISYQEDSQDTYCDEDVYFTKKDGKILPLDTSNVEDYLDTLSGLALTDYVTYNVTEEELKTFGLDQPELTVTIEYADQEENEEEKTKSFVLCISQDPQEKEDAENASITSYVRFDDSQIVYAVNSTRYIKLTDVSCDTLRHQEIFTADFGDVTQIDVTLDGEEYTITSAVEEDVRAYYYGEKITITKLKKALNALTAESFTQELPAEKEEISLVLHLDHENASKVSIALYRYDGSSCLAVVDGEPVALIARADMVDLVEAVNAIVLNEKGKM